MREQYRVGRQGSLLENTLAVAEIKFYQSIYFHAQTARSRRSEETEIQLASQLKRFTVLVIWRCNSYRQGNTHKDQLPFIDVLGVKTLIMLRNESMKNLTQIICIPVCFKTFIQVFFSVVNFFLKFGFRIKMALAFK